MSKPVPLMPLFLVYQQLAGCAECEAADRLRGDLEHALSASEVVSADDLFTKARYLQDCGRIDPGLIPMEALDTLVAGVARLLGPGLSQAAA